MTMQGPLNLRWQLGALLFLSSLVVLSFPQYFASRAFFLSLDPDANLWVVRGVAVAFLGMACALVLEPEDAFGRTRPGTAVVMALITMFYFLALTIHLADWWIDDAGITFAYSRSLAEGLGLVAQPWMQPEEGYSSSTWMLLLAFMGSMGLDIPLAAKILGVTFSTLSMGLCALVVAREINSPLALLICGIGIACAPTVVWAASGQEHALQSLILLAVVVCTYLVKAWRWPVSIILAILVLTRPEGPIIVIAVFCMAVFLTRRAGGTLINAADAVIAMVPFAAFVALIAFRTAYFGDPMPNPFYAKSSGTGFLGLFNPLGGGWAYTLGGFRDTALFFVIWLAFTVSSPRQSEWHSIGVAILIGQLVFVIWAKGDWMGQSRFLMPVLPIVLLLAAVGLQSLPTRRVRTVFSGIAVLVLVHTSVLNLAAFKARPTTPMSVVTQVGDTFRQLADRTGIENPVLAHHDAGGISYHRMVRLVDLGGLVNRMIAQNMDDRDFLTRYLLEEVQPDFFFGGINFATGSGFADTDRFAQDYVPLEFVGLPFMRSGLTHIRRSRAIEAPGVALVYDQEGNLILVRVEVM